MELTDAGLELDGAALEREALPEAEGEALEALETLTEADTLALLEALTDAEELAGLLTDELAEAKDEVEERTDDELTELMVPFLPNRVRRAVPPHHWPPSPEQRWLHSTSGAFTAVPVTLVPQSGYRTAWLANKDTVVCSCNGHGIRRSQGTRPKKDDQFWNVQHV